MAVSSPSLTSGRGVARPLGATPDAGGTNFAVFAQHATAMHLCLFDGDVETRVAMRRTGSVWHAYVPGVGAGTRYGFRADGPWDPSRALRYNAANLLLDPYTRAVDGYVDWRDPVYGFDPAVGESAFNAADSAALMPRSVVVDGTFDWGDDAPPAVAMADTVIYEVHVRGFTKLHPDVPQSIRGTWAGLAHPAAIAHLQRVGVTTVELLPVQHHIDDHMLLRRGLTNYWGYQPICYFAPHPEYASTTDPEDGVAEFKSMVKGLHAAGIEVVIDVVYNHTGEWDETGPTLCYRGLDDLAYYRHPSDDPGPYVNYTGVGNTLDLRNPYTLQLVMDSLRYWVTEMHVDGFRFDLATTLARGEVDYDRHGGFLAAVQQDPVLSGVKLIAEPWDVGPGSFQVGNFPAAFSEWNGLYRDVMRDFWRGAERGVTTVARRFMGSDDLYADDGRDPQASVNFITAHDGFTLRDLVSYNDKHNQANGDNNTDGEGHNRSWNCGVEGPTDDPAVNRLRSRQQRNFMATLMLSQGVPMMLGGDEMSRTQHGNNNAYCHDNELSWFDWDLSRDAEQMLEWTSRLVAFRREQPVLRHRHYLTGRPSEGSRHPDVAWFTLEGEPMTAQDWAADYARTLALRLDGEALDEAEAEVAPNGADTLYVILNGYTDALPFTLPPVQWGEQWEPVIDTADPGLVGGTVAYAAGSAVQVEGFSVMVLRLRA
jgi:isoamylase